MLKASVGSFKRKKIPIEDQPPDTGEGLWELSIVVGVVLIVVVVLYLAAGEVAYWVLG